MSVSSASIQKITIQRAAYATNEFIPDVNSAKPVPDFQSIDSIEITLLLLKNKN
jgi:hypothetical protein